MEKYTRAVIFLVVTLMLLVLDACGGIGGQCPSVCSCKWKGGKQSVECTDRALITIPESVDAATQVLDLSGNNLQILPRETFLRAGLLNLQRVFLRSCRIGQIDDLAFRGLTNLIDLDLSFNLLTAIPSGTFQDVPLLRDLVLSNNPIQKVDSHAFRTVPNLVKLDLSNCELQMIAPKAFEGIEVLGSLKLNGNRLTELRPKTVETLSRLQGIELHDNPWHCDCRLRPVKEWLTHRNIPYPVAPVCSGGPERVIHKTFGELHVDDFACKPEILPVSRFIEATAGDNATITCRASAVPSAHINWYWNGRLLLNNSAFSTHQKIYIYDEGHFEKRSNLVLTNAMETDSSEFYCVAENRAGNAEANFTLRVSMRTAGMVTLGSGQIAGLSAALVILILFILLVILVLLVRLRRMPFSESKTPGQIEVVTVVNGGAIPNGKSATISPVNETSSFTERKLPQDLNFCNPVQKPPRMNEIPYTTTHYNGNGSIMNPGSCFVSPSSGSGNNPDLINDTKMLGSGDLGPVNLEETFMIEAIERPGSGDYSRNADSLYPSGLWENGPDSVARHLGAATNPGFHYDDKTPIVGSDEELNFAARSTTSYPPDYGLPIAESKSDVSSTSASQIILPTNAKTLRVWQKGAVPVLPPVTALKRALSHSRSSPDEGYQEGCGTDV
ncbi:PREDICTED: leucine-rich repeat-containing protein 24 [Nicrophorus vespilloides]|uniref:Leucine-rich repeat-containing protein 24 n=1 Tax=Nicrophorus vespilloides TaxID=110193 RepID=A0ABM1NIW6_NICVS|nr:PREDICTED: leucine-rich repeat-containing protein 24 [Nicrophorus vespilloides]